MPPLPPEQAVFSPGRSAMMLSRDAGSGPMLPFCKKRQHISLAQKPATELCGSSRELRAYMCAHADAHCVFVQWQEWWSIHLGETEASVIEVAGIAANLGIDHLIDLFRF